MPSTASKQTKARGLLNNNQRVQARDVWRDAWSGETPSVTSRIISAAMWYDELKSHGLKPEPDDHKLVIWFLDQAEKLAVNAEAWITCAAALRQLLGDQHADDDMRVIGFLDQAQRSATGAGDWIACATAQKQLLGGKNAQVCLEEAERVATANLDSTAMSWCARAYENLLNDPANRDRCRAQAELLRIERTRSQLRKAERVATANLDSTAMSQCASDYENLLNDLANRDRCKAEAVQLLPEFRADPSLFSTLEQVLREAQARGNDFPGGDTPDAIVRRETASNGVFFYPACGVDWNPLHRFSGRCDTFIYCDYNTTLEEVLDGLSDHHRYFRVNHAILIPPEFVQAMTHDNLMPDDGENRVSMVEPWGCLFSLTCNATKPPNKLHLIYLAVEGVTLYANLFRRRTHSFLSKVWAPEYLCIKNDGMGFGNGWAAFRDWERPLGNEVSQNPKQPKFLACNLDFDLADRHTWPWTQRWLTFQMWGGPFDEAVRVYHRPEVMPTKKEGEDFCLPGIPNDEWPEISPQAPRPTVPPPLEADAVQPPGEGPPNQDFGNNPPNEGHDDDDDPGTVFGSAVADFGALHNKVLQELPHDIYRDFKLSEDEPGVFRISVRVAAPVVSPLDKQRIAEDLKTRLSQIVQQIRDQPSPEQWHWFHGVQFNEICFSSWWVTVKMTVEFVNNG